MTVYGDSGMVGFRDESICRQCGLCRCKARCCDRYSNDGLGWPNSIWVSDCLDNWRYNGGWPEMRGFTYIAICRICEWMNGTTQVLAWLVGLKTSIASLQAVPWVSST